MNNRGQTTIKSHTRKTQAIKAGSVHVTRTLGYLWQDGRLTRMTYPSGRVVDFAYDAQGRVTGLAVDGQPLLFGVAYQPFGAARAWTWGNGQTHSRVFDLDGRLAAYPLGDLLRSVQFDPAGRMIRFQHPQAAFDQQFGYDSLDRLTDFVSYRGVEAYLYDADGNRSSLTLGANTYPYSVAGQSNRLLAVAGPTPRSYAHDAMGNIVQDGTTAYTYAWWWLARSTRGGQAHDYLPNALGQRVQKSGPLVPSGVARFVYDEALRLVGEYDAANLPLQETVFLGNTPVAVLKGNAIYYVHADHLNTPRVITDTLGRTVWRWLADPFGAALPEEDPDGNGVAFSYNPRFPGQYFDKETGLHYNYHRYYDPLTGRYLQTDPIGLAGGLNLYAYVGGNPVSGIDPLGLATYVTIWQPVGWGESSFGHVSTDISGTTYSFGPGGMSVMPTADYAARNGFRDGMAVGLKLTPQQEAAVQVCMSRSQGSYSATGNNCGSPIQNCLKQVGINTGIQTLPVSLGNRLLDMGIVNGIKEYPASRPGGGRGAPWAR